MRIRRGLLTAILLVATFCSVGRSYAQNGGARYFPETGHWVSGDFLKFYERAPDSNILYGYPITDAFQTQTIPQNLGILVQYFEKVRLEYHPENPPELRVVLSPLGEYIYEYEGRNEAVRVSPNLTACRRIPQDGYPICYSFLSFFDKYGGIAQFGYPISEIEQHDGWMVQYFQWARYEWHPELPVGQQVTLTDLGESYFAKTKEAAAMLLPSQEDFAATVLSLQAYAFVSRAVVASNGTQVVYVVVQDQNLRPVPNAMVSMVVTLPSGTELRNILPLTNQFGVTSITLSLDAEPLGMAIIEVTITNNLLEAYTRTSFRVW